jgi:hypothetical protein
MIDVANILNSERMLRLRLDCGLADVTCALVNLRDHQTERDVGIRTTRFASSFWNNAFLEARGWRDIVGPEP